MTEDGLQAFVAQYWEDRKAGQVRELPEYLAMFPGDANAIAREFLALEVPPKGELESESIGPYRIEEELGRGGQGVVYRAIDTRVGRTVALKVLHALGPGSEEVLQRFQREARVASRLDDPGICTVYDTGTEGGIPYIAMRYVEGASVAQMISTCKERQGSESHSTCVVLSDSEEEEGTAPPAASATDTAREAAPGSRDVLEVAAFFEKVARSLHEAHEAGVIHRDVKPGNIMLTPKGEPVIMDFGLARGEELDLQTLTRTGEFFGTPAYMSPEQLLAQRVKLDRRTDIWSLGVSLYECLTLQRPFEAPTRDGLYQAIQSKDPEHPRRLNRQIPRDLATLVTVCLAKDRDRRYQSALQLAQDLRRLQRREPIAARPIGPVERLIRWAQRRPYRAASLVLAFLGIASVSWYVAKAPERAALEQKARLQEANERKQELEGLLHDAYLCIHERVPPVALGIFEQANALVPDDPEAVAGLAITLTLADRRDDARRLLDQHLTDDGAKPAGLAHVRHWVTRKEGEPFAPADTYPPETAQDHFLFGYLRLLDDHLEEDLCREALPHFTRATVLSSPRCLHLVCRARAAAKIDDAEVAAECEEALIRLWPDEAYAWYGVGIARFGEERREERRQAYERAVELRPFAPVLDWLSWILKSEGKRGEALAAAERAVAASPGYYRSWQRMGSLLGDFGRHEEALAAYERAIEIKTDSYGAWVGKGWTLRVLERHEEAIEAYDQAIRVKPDFAIAWYNKGTALSDLRRFEQAIEAYDQAIRIKPDFAEAWINKGNALSGLRRFEQAIEAYDQAIRIKPDFALAWTNKGVAFKSIGRNQEALDAHYEATRIDASNDVAWRNKGLALVALGRRAEAMEAFTEAIRIKSDCDQAWNMKGVCLYELKRYAQALACFEQAIQARPDEAQYWFHKGTALNALGRHEEAIVAYDETIRIDKEHSSVWHNKGNALSSLGRHEEAIVAYDEAIRIKPDDSTYWRNKGLVLRRLSRHDEALEAYDEAVRIKPDRAEAWNSKGKSLSDLGRYAEALSCFDQAARIRPDKAEYSYDKGSAFFRLRRLKDAIVAYDQAIRVNNDHVESWANKGVCLFDLERYAEALACFEQALRIRPDGAQNWFNKGNALSSIGRHQEAIAAYDEAIRVEPDNAPAWYNKGSALRLLGRHQEAIAAYGEAVRIKPDNTLYHRNLRRLLGQRGDYSALLRELKRWAALHVEDPTTQHDLAWQLLRIARREPDLADSEAALAGARKAVQLTEERDPRMLRTLALALVADDESAEARKYCEQALALLEKQEEPDTQLKADLESLLRRLQDAEKE